VDDIPLLANTFFLEVGTSDIAFGNITSMDLTQVNSSEGVELVLTVDDIPGLVDIGPVFPGDDLLTKKTVQYVGQPIFAVVATNKLLAQQAIKKAVIEYEELDPILTIKQALDAKFFVRPTHRQSRGDSLSAINNASNTLQSDLYVKGQEHFYLEGQVSMAVPNENQSMLVYTSSQHPSEVQKLVAEVLDVSLNKVQVEVRRLGGGFGGKETQAAGPACLAALGASKLNKPVKYTMSRFDDMTGTGKRHDFYNTYEIGFDDLGIISGANISVTGKCGHSPDLSDAIVDRAMFHCDNAYYLNNATVVGHRAKTHTVSNTAYRGFGGPQGVIVAELMMDDIATHLNEDPLTIRKRNLYGVTHQHIKNSNGEVDPRNETHYGQEVEQHVLPKLMEQLEENANYWQRKKEIKEFNKRSRYLKKGLALTPVKFGISFTAHHLNQAGSLVHVYTDGSVQVSHGGTEMGQGLYQKIRQITASVFSIDHDNIEILATRTDKVPNTSPTAASSGTDLNGMATLNACEMIKSNIIEFLTTQFNCKNEDVSFKNNFVFYKQDGEEKYQSFTQIAQLAYMNRVQLSASGFYKTPKIHYDFESAKGRPFYYYANGACVSEVIIDCLTGENKVVQCDILHDVGQSINPAIDIGQIEGAFVQAMGWLTTEDLVWNEKGRILSNGPATYKIPSIGDTPLTMNVELYQDEFNNENTVYQSKAVGEPPFMLGISVWSAIRDAISSVFDYKKSPKLNCPATPEEILTIIQKMH